MRESVIEQYFCQLVKKAGGRAYKWVSPGNKGVPDRIVFLCGRIFFVELKATSGKLSSMQVVQHRELANLGQHVVLVSSKGQAKAWVAAQVEALSANTLKIDWGNWGKWPEWHEADTPVE